MRTQDDIVAKIKEWHRDDLFGFKTDTLIPYLDYEHAKEFLKPDTTKEKWDKVVKPNTREQYKKDMLEYMPFAWDKANNFRGISAQRSIGHYEAWTWLEGSHDSFDFDNYEFYGKDILADICAHYGWNSKQWDDGVRLNEEP